MISQYANKLNWIINDFKSRVDPEINKKLEDAMFNMDSSLQVQNIIDMVFDSSQENRDIIENFIIQLRAGKINAI